MFIPQPTLNYVVFATHFPVKPSIYLASIMSGNLIRSIDLSAYSTKSPKIFTCHQNDYVFGVSSGSMMLWSSKSILSEQPMRVWMNIDHE